MRHEVISLSEGWAGTNQTVATIMRLVDDSLTDPLVVTTAQNIVRGVPERDRMGELRAVSAYVRSRMRYTNESIETLKTPRLMIQEIQKYGKAVGDCDDSVILWMALLKSVGHQVRATVVSQRKDKAATHIYAEDNINGRWVTDDTIVKGKPLGWAVPEREKTATRHYAASMAGVACRPVGCEKNCGRSCNSRGVQMRDYLQVGGVRQSVTQWERREHSPFAKFTIFNPGVRQQAVSDFLPRKTYFGGNQVRPFLNVKMGGMIEVNEWGMGEAIGFIPGSIGDVGKAKWLKAAQKIAAKVAPKLVKALPFAAGAGVLAIAAKKVAAAAAARKKAREAGKAAPDVVPGSTDQGQGDPNAVDTSYQGDEGGGGGGGGGGSGGGGGGGGAESSSAAATMPHPSYSRAPSGGGDNTGLYIGLGAAALLAIILMGRK